MADDFNELGKKVRLSRVTAGSTQQEFAEKLGIARNYLSELERGKAKPSYDLLTKIERLIEETSADQKNAEENLQPLFDGGNDRQAIIAILSILTGSQLKIVLKFLGELISKEDT